MGLRDGRLVVNEDVVEEPWADPRLIDSVFFGPVDVPTGTVFVLGDKRAGSVDSRSSARSASQMSRERSSLALDRPVRCAGRGNDEPGCAADPPRAGSVPALGAAAGPAAAHADLLASTPVAGADIDDPVTAVTLDFAVELVPELARIRVIDAQGRDRVAGTPAVLGGRLSVAVEAPANGRYRVAYRVVAADGHPVVGEFDFRAEGQSGSARPLDGTVGAAVDLAAAPGWGLLSSMPGLAGLVAAALVLARVRTGWRGRGGDSTYAGPTQDLAGQPGTRTSRGGIARTVIGLFAVTAATAAVGFLIVLPRGTTPASALAGGPSTSWMSLSRALFDLAHSARSEPQ